MKYFAYCRVSSEREDRQVLSPESQKRELKNYAQKHELNVIKTFTERGSAYKPGRAEFNKMLEALEKKEADGILVFHLSRLARNGIDSGRIIDMIDRKILKQIRTKDKIYENHPDDKMMMGFNFTLDKKSSDDNSTYVKRDIITKISKQEFPGRAPLGYLNMSKDGVIVGKQYDHKKQEILQTLGRPLKRIEKDPLVAPLLRKMFELALTNQYGLNPLREAAFEFGVVSAQNTMLSKSALKKILTNPFYAGSFSYYEKNHQGNHEPIITESEFERIQEIQGNRSRPKTTKREYLLSMLIKCSECGHPLSSEHQKKHDYLRCAKAKGNNPTCTNRKHYQQAKVEAQILKKLEEIEIPKSIVEWSIKQLSEMYAQEDECNLASQEKLNSNNSVLKRQITNLNQKWLSAENLNGDLISDNEYQNIKEDLQRQIKNNEGYLKGLEGEQENWLQKCESFFEASRVIVSTYKESNIKEKRIFIEAIGYKSILNQGILTMELNKPYFEVAEANQRIKAIRTAKKLVSESDNSVLESEMDVWQAQ